MHNMLISKKLLVVLLIALPFQGVAQHRAAIGPPENVQSVHRAITVLGQTFEVNDATRLAVDGELVSWSLVRGILSQDQDIYIEGEDQGETTAATLVSVSRSTYVSGATPVYVLGTVEEISTSNGLIRVRSLRIDSSTMDPDLLATLEVGSLVEVSGVQPAAGGTIVDSELLSVGGSGIQRQGVGGSGFQLRSVGGSGFQLQSVGGSGIQRKSVGGSGSQKQSVGGSGAQLQSVGGSGAQLQSVGGSGIQVQSVGGSGKKTRSVGGSGIQLQSVGGSGIQLQSVGGSGIQTQSVGGSGIQVRSVGGSGK